MGLDFSRVTTYPIAERKNKERIAAFSRPISGTQDFPSFLATLPNNLRARQLRELARKIADCAKAKRPVVLALGGHVIKCGLNPLIIDLMERGIVTALALNGSCAIHDYEFSLIGETSEDVGASLHEGRFGMVEETAVHLFEAVAQGLANGNGMGEAVGRYIMARGNPHAGVSILASAARCKAVATVHVAFGTDIIHQHPKFDPRAFGEATHRDFQRLCEVVATLGGTTEAPSGGVWLNIGSAVILPEVFLKALSVCANLGYTFGNLATANFDMVESYRPRVNVVARPTQEGGQGYSFIGHHEIMVPLLYNCILFELGN